MPGCAILSAPFDGERFPEVFPFELNKTPKLKRIENFPFTNELWQIPYLLNQREKHKRPELLLLLHGFVLREPPPNGVVLKSFWEAFDRNLSGTEEQRKMDRKRDYEKLRDNLHLLAGDFKFSVQLDYVAMHEAFPSWLMKSQLLERPFKRVIRIVIVEFDSKVDHLELIRFLRDAETVMELHLHECALDQAELSLLASL